MRNRKIILTLAAALLLSTNLVGCGNQGSTSSEGTSSEASTAPAATAIAETGNEDQADPSSSSEEVYYGTWKINRALAFAPVGTFSTDDVESMINRELSFSKDHAVSFGDRLEYLNNTMQNPQYVKTVISRADFVENYRVTFEQLGITADEITEVKATDADGNDTVLLIKDVNTLILVGGGVFLELIRA